MLNPYAEPIRFTTNSKTKPKAAFSKSLNANLIGAVTIFINIYTASINTITEITSSMN